MTTYLLMPAVALTLQVNLRHYGLVAELYFMGCGLPTDDVRALIAWADQRKVIKHIIKQASADA